MGAGAATAANWLSRSTAAPSTPAAETYSAQYPDMLANRIIGKLNSLNARWDAERARIHTAAEVAERNHFVREKFREMIHGYPERNPLDAITVAARQRDGYHVENVMFQSRPDFWVTGNLYVPEPRRGRCAGIVSPTGHAAWGRMDPEYQTAYISLAKAGFVVLSLDPIGQGERRQFWNPQTGVTDVGSSPTTEHSMSGQLLLLMGDNLTLWRVWDAMRAIDYLQSLPEVDPEQIGCAGHSGGSTLGLFVSSLDDRIKCTVCAEGGRGSHFPIDLRPETRIHEGDVEQNIFPAANYGVDLPDLNASIAPRPLLQMIEDHSPANDRAGEYIASRYSQLGVPDRFRLLAANDPHAWTPKLRIATVKWFRKWMYGQEGPDREPDITVERPDTLYCTPNGSLRYSQQGESIFSIILKQQAHLPPPRDRKPAELAREVAQVLRYRKSDVPLAPRSIVTTPRKGYSIKKLEFLSEPGIYIPTWVFVPEKKMERYPAVLALNDAGKEADGMEFGLYERLARQGKMVIACDVRGIGETTPPHPPASDHLGAFGQLFNVDTALTYMAWYVDEDLCGMRVQDAVRSVDYTLSRQDVDPHRFQVAGKGAGALWVLYAAALDPRITDVVAEGGLLSYRSLAQVDRYIQPTSIFVRDLLLHFDLPQIAAGLAGRNLTIAGPVDAMKHPVPLDVARECYAPAEESFRRAAKGQFRVAAAGFIA
jgi:cephalosporin-C deacetylase-like acetyl esterase